VTESDAAQWAAFNKVYHEIGNRLRIFLSLPLNKLDRISLQQAMRTINLSSPT
jgi:arsenate reductase